MIQNTIILFTEVLVAHVEQKRDPQQSRTPAAPATLFMSSRQLERVFWFCCTWGMESDKERTGWDAFVFSRLQQSSAASVHHPHQDDSAEGVDATTPMNHHRLRRGVSPIQSRPSSAAAAAQLLVSPLRSRCVSPLSGSAMDDASIAQHDGEDDEGALYPPGGIPLHACGLDFATLQWASWTDASESCFPILFPTSATSSSATISNSTMWRSLWKSNTIIAALIISSLYLRHHRHHRRALRRRSIDDLLPLPASVKSPPLLAFCGPSATGKTLLASVAALQAHVTANSEDPSTAASSGGGYYEILSTRCLDSARADSIYRELDAAPSGGGGGPLLILDGEPLPSSEESQHHHHIDAFDVLLANVFHCHSGPGDLARDDDDVDEQKHSSNSATTTTPPLHTDGLSHHQAVQKKNKKDGVVIVSRNATRIASMCPTIFIRAEQLQDECGDAAGAADTFGAKLAECLRPVAQVGGVLYRHVPLYQFTSVRRWASAHAVLRALSDSSHPTTTFYALLMQHWSSCCHDSRELMALDQLLLQVFSVVDPSHNVVLHDDEHGELGAMEESRAIHNLREAVTGASSPQYAVAAPIISSSSATTQDDDPAAGSRPQIHEQLPIASLVTSTSAKRISAMYCLLSSVSAGGVWLTAPASWKSVTTVVNIGAGNTDDDATTTLESGAALVVPPQAAVEIPQHHEGGGASSPEVVTTTDVAANAHGTSTSPTASSTAAATPVPPTSTSPTPLSTTTGAGSPISGAAASPVTNASSEDPTTLAQQSPTVKSITTTDVNVVGDVVGELCILSQLLHVELFYVTSPMSVSQGVEERMEDVDDATSLPSRPSSAGLRSNQHQLQRSNSAMGSLSSTPLPHNADASVTSLRLPGSLAAAMKTAPSSGPVYWIPAGEIRSQEDATAVEHAMLRGVRIVIDAVRHHHIVAEEAWGCGGDDEPHTTLWRRCVSCYQFCKQSAIRF
uniref:Uncharacterized protein n=1 Tax=Bodo saltans TaxID=75058 RepID=B6DT91_BODSA|nr:hypothetical protein [Bodo saltans]